MTDAATEKLIFALPSKGRLKEDALRVLGEAGLRLGASESGRGYRATIENMPDVEVRFVSASEIAKFLDDGRAHLGVTGDDLLAETIPRPQSRVKILKPLGFGHADLVVAVPACWLDVRSFEDLEDVALVFRREHGRRLRVATKFFRLTRAAFAKEGIVSYRIVESLGATEGAPAAGLADLIVDITTTGSTLADNGLKKLEDPPLLRSQANLVESLVNAGAGSWPRAWRRAKAEILRSFGVAP